MGKNYLSLKNIYRFLFEEDYPVYSFGIIPRKNKKGYTLRRFWGQVYINDFKNKKYGKMIFRMEGSYNRLFSEFANRKNDFKYYGLYKKEAFSILNDKTFLKQVNSFEKFLSDNDVDYNAFFYKVPYVIQLIGDEDPLFNEEHRQFFYHLLEKKDAYATSQKREYYFMSYILTMLLLHSIYLADGNDALTSVLQNQKYSDQLIYEKLHAEKKENVIISNIDNDILMKKQLHFIGREKELIDLRDFLYNKEKIIITGKIGNGKTELIKMFAKVVFEETDDTNIAYLECCDSLEETLNCLVNQYGSFNELAEDEKSLVIINNYQSQFDLLPLLKLKGCVIVENNSDIKEQNFKEYYIPDLSYDSILVLLRDIGLSVEKTDLVKIQKVLRNKTDECVASIKLLGINTNHIKMNELLNLLRNNETSSIIELLFENSGFNDKHKKIFIEIVENKKIVEDIDYLNELKELTAKGWLEERKTIYKTNDFIYNYLKEKVWG